LGAGYEPRAAPIPYLPQPAQILPNGDSHTPSPHPPCIREAERIAANPCLSQLIEAGQG